MYISKLNRKIFILKDINIKLDLIVYKFIRVYLFRVNRQNLFILLYKNTL